MFKGYKTYIIAALAGMLSTAKYMGWIDYNTFEAIMGILAGAGMATLRNAVTTETAALPKPEG